MLEIPGAADRIPAPPLRHSIRWRRVGAAVVLTVVAIWWLVEFAANLYWAPANLANDFWTYRQAGLDVLAGRPIYAPDEIARPFILPAAAFGHGFVYPPFAALAAIPLAVLPPVVGFSLFTFATAVALVGVTMAIGRREGLRGRRWAAAIAFLTLANGPAVAALASANLNGLIAAALGAMWLTRGGRVGSP